MKNKSVDQLEQMIREWELLFMYIAPSSEKPIRNWWPPSGYEPYQHPEAEAEPFPSQAEVFWAMVEDLKRPPTQEEFGRQFFRVYKSFNKWGRLFDDKWVAWGTEARVRRTYPSFVREFHVEFLLREVFGDDCVDRAKNLDYSGVDFIVKVDREWHPVRTYVDSKRSSQFAKDKSTTRHKHVGLSGAFDLVLPLRDSYQVGQFKLYSREQVQALKEQIHARMVTNS